LSDEVLIVLAEDDPVAGAVAGVWGTLPATGLHVDGAPVRTLAPGFLALRRPGSHIRDDGLDARLPGTLREAKPVLVFPSIHRSEQNVPSLTVHPLGNPGPDARLGGRPCTLVPTDPLRMASALRVLDEGARAIGWDATFESTHHGPFLESPAFFVEVGYADLPHPPTEAVRVLAEAIPRIRPDARDRVALGVGGGHYAPHFTELALARCWAFGHLISRHSLATIDRATAESAYAQSGRAEGIVYARAQDAGHPSIAGLAPRLRDQDAPPRDVREGAGATGAARSASGT
jgi:D-tyrosyl-tRNA(Tyr) deacylase